MGRIMGSTACGVWGGSSGPRPFSRPASYFFEVVLEDEGGGDRVEAARLATRLLPGPGLDQGLRRAAGSEALVVLDDGDTRQRVPQPAEERLDAARGGPFLARLGQRPAEHDRLQPVAVPELLQPLDRLAGREGAERLGEEAERVGHGEADAAGAVVHGGDTGAGRRHGSGQKRRPGPLRQPGRGKYDAVVRV